MSSQEQDARLAELSDEVEELQRHALDALSQYSGKHDVSTIRVPVKSEGCTLVCRIRMQGRKAQGLPLWFSRTLLPSGPTILFTLYII